MASENQKPDTQEKNTAQDDETSGAIDNANSNEPADDDSSADQDGQHGEHVDGDPEGQQSNDPEAKQSSRDDANKKQPLPRPDIDIPDGYRLFRDDAGGWDVELAFDSAGKHPHEVRQQMKMLSKLRAAIEAQQLGFELDDQALPSLLDGSFRPWEDIDPHWILKCMSRNVTGDAELYCEMHKKRIAIDILTGSGRTDPERYFFDKHHWKMDYANAVSNSIVEHLCLAYQHAFAEVRIGPLENDIFDIDKRLDKREITDDQRKELIEERSKKQGLIAQRRKNLNDRLRTLRTPARENGIMTKVRSVIGHPLNIETHDLDQHGNLLAVPNGVIDLDTGDFRAGNPDDWLVRSCGVEWEGFESDISAWLEFLGTTYANPKTGEPRHDLIAFLQRLLGMGLFGGQLEHVLPVFTGRGRNGKSVFCNVLKVVLGALAGAMPAELLLDQGNSRSADSPSPSIMGLKGLRIAWASETAEGRRFSIDLIKRMTGGDPLTGRNPNDKYQITFMPTHLTLLLTNKLPKAPATDYAFWERIVVIPHETSFVKRDPIELWEKKADPRLSERLSKCMPGILAWLVQGHLQYKQQGLNPPEIVTEATQAYRDGEDVIGEFIAECCDINENFKVNSAKLYKIFKEFYTTHKGDFPIKQETFTSWMKDKGYNRVKNSTFFYVGITLRPEYQESYSQDSVK